MAAYATSADRVLVLSNGQFASTGGDPKGRFALCSGERSHGGVPGGVSAWGGQGGGGNR
jgi:hypothetical protein